MSTEQPRDPESGKFTSEGAEPTPAQPEGSPAGEAPEGGWTPEQALQFVSQAGFDPGSDAYDVGRRANNWAQLEDDRQAAFAYQQLKAKFEPETPSEPEQPNPWDQFNQPQEQAGIQTPQEFQPPPQMQQPVQQGIDPQQLQELLGYERQQMESSVVEQVQEQNLLDNLNYELTETGIDDQGALQFLMNDAYAIAKQQGVPPRQAVNAAKERFQAMIEAQAKAQEPATGAPGNAPAQPPDGSAANPFQPPQSLEDAYNISKEFGNM